MFGPLFPKFTAAIKFPGFQILVKNLRKWCHFLQNTALVEIEITIWVGICTNVRAKVFVLTHANCCANCYYNFNPCGILDAIYSIIVHFKSRVGHSFYKSLLPTSENIAGVDRESFLRTKRRYKISACSNFPLGVLWRILRRQSCPRRFHWINPKALLSWIISQGSCVKVVFATQVPWKLPCLASLETNRSRKSFVAAMLH